MAIAESTDFFGSQATSCGDYVELPDSPSIPVLNSFQDITCEEEEEEEKEAMGVGKGVPCRKTVAAYGVGHMLNDLTAACWFTYLLIFLTDIGLSPREAAAVMMAGQFADAVATLIVGRLIDNFGHFKLWHAGGSLLVALSFSSVFGGCLVCMITGFSSSFVRTVSYSFFAAVFNCGWAATQVSHMSLVNCMTSNSSSRVTLNSCRNAFTMVANLGLYGIAYLAFWLVPSKTQLDVQLQFRWIAGSAVALGLVLVIVFHGGVREPRLLHVHNLEIPRRAWTSWFSSILYYQVAVVYMLTRLATNVSQAMLPFFLIDDLGLPQSSKAVVPAFIYVFSFLASVVLQELHWTGRRLKVAFIGGSILWVFAGFIFYQIDQSQQLVIYILAMGIGIANALILVSATSMEGVLVANNLSGCAFVYGSLSFLDKLACGFALYFIEALNVKEDKVCTPLGGSCHRSLVRWVLTLVPSGCALLAGIFAIIANLNDDEGSGEGSRGSLKEGLLGKKGRVIKVEEEESERRSSGSNHSGAMEIPRRRTRGGSVFEGRDEEAVLHNDSRGENVSVGFCNVGETELEGRGVSNLIQQILPWAWLNDAMVGRWGSIRALYG